MTSRRPMTRTYSGSGRTSSFNEEDGGPSNGRSESRNTYLSNVRPENRSTLCSVMAQLTEDIQPSFDNTLKSKAVSENCNVKFTCVVSGYPAPELKWYKDDMEMDRYCGLPKYEIRRNGKTHTLHIYNCTLDDAAIYQVSASNSKGIVSCSGVLEVGTMNEFQIHQRFFAKLKQKAEKKKSEMEAHSKKEDKASTQREKPRGSPERPPRKRPVPPSLEKKPVVKDPEAVEQVGAVAEANGVSSDVREAVAVTPKDGDLEKEAASKKIKIANGVDGPVSSISNASRSHMMGNGGENCYDGGISLAQFLAETLQSQVAEEKQSSPRAERHKETDVTAGNVGKEEDREQEDEDNVLEEEHDRERRHEEELDRDKEKERQRKAHVKHGSESKYHNKAHKENEHHKIQASISSMLHSVKDFLFGKSKKDSHDHTESKEKDLDHLPCQPETPPSFRLQPEHQKASAPVTEDTEGLMGTDRPTEPETVSPETHETKHADGIQHAELSSPVMVEEPAWQTVEVVEEAVEAMEVSAGSKVSGPVEEMSLSGLQVYPTKPATILQHEPGCPAVSQEPDNQKPTDESSRREDILNLPQTKAPNEEECPVTHTSLEESWTPPKSINLSPQSHKEVPTETVQDEDMNVEKTDKEREPVVHKGCHPTDFYEEEKAEVKLDQRLLSNVTRSEKTELTSCSSEERTEPWESETTAPVLPSQSEFAVFTKEIDRVKKESEQTSPIKEMNVGYPLNAGPETVEVGDLEIQQENLFSILEERTGDHDMSTIQSSNLGHGSGSLEKEEWKKKEQAVLEGAFTDVEDRNKSLLFEKREEERSHAELEGMEESLILQEAQDREGDGDDLVEKRNDEDEESVERKLALPPVNIPQIQISAIEESTDVQPCVPTVNEKFVIPQIEVVAPELTGSSLPLTLLAPNKPESEPKILQSHDTTHVCDEIIEKKNVIDSPGLLPTQTGMQNDCSLPPTEKVKEVAQSDDEAEIFNHKQPGVIDSQQLPRVEVSSIPVINVLCSDEKEEDVHVNSHVSDAQQPFETPTVAVFVVPPISVTCYESDSALTQPAHGEWAETETSDVTQRGTEKNIIDTPAEPGKTQGRNLNRQEPADYCIEEKPASTLFDAPTPKIVDNEDSIISEILKIKPLKEAKTENVVSLEDLQKNRSSVERLCSKPPTYPSLSPSSLRKFMSRAAPDTDGTASDRQSDKADEDLSGGSTPTSSLSCESSPRLKRRDSLTLIRSATPEELASGARRKIFIPKPKEDVEGGVLGALDSQGKKESPYMSPSQARRAALLQTPTGQNTPPMERRSPLLSRRKITLEVPKVVETPKEEPENNKREEKPEKKLDPLKAPQVIRKIRGEPFPDASGHLKLWCQFFNVLSDSTIKWFRDEEEILEVKRSGGDESQVALAIVLATSKDCGVYGCSIKNEYGTDVTDFLLSEDILSEILLREDLEVGEEIEMTPLLFSRGLADGGNWGEKYFGRIMTEEAHVGEGCAHKASRVKVIYGLDPIYESGSACMIKVQNPIPYGTKQESNLAERNAEITKQRCKIQDLIREYCKIFAAEARVTENFGSALEVIPQYLMYRPANTVPYASVEAHLSGDFLRYCGVDPKGKLVTQTASEVEQKCCTFQHWIHQWTHGNLLVTRLEGVDVKITNIRVVTKSKGYQGLTEKGSPEVFEQFITHHQCNYYCGLLGLHPLKSADGLQQPKTKGSRSPLLNRKVGSSSPQPQRKGHSPQVLRKASSSPKVQKKVQDTEDNKPKLAQTADALESR